MSQRTQISHAKLAASTYALLGNINSVALALESLELLLIEKGVLKDNEVMTRMEALMKEKCEQVEAADAIGATPNSGGN